MRYYKRENVYKNSTGSFEYNPDNHKSYSYGWYELSKECKNKKGDTIIVINNYSYSMSTCKHISHVRGLIGYDTPNVISIQAPRGLQDKESSIRYYTSKISDNRTKAYAPRTRKRDYYKTEARLYYEKLKLVKELL